MRNNAPNVCQLVAAQFKCSRKSYNVYPNGSSIGRARRLLLPLAREWLLNSHDRCESYPKCSMNISPTSAFKASNKQTYRIEYNRICISVSVSFVDWMWFIMNCVAKVSFNQFRIHYTHFYWCNNCHNMLLFDTFTVRFHSCNTNSTRRIDVISMASQNASDKHVANKATNFMQMQVYLKS